MCAVDQADTLFLSCYIHFTKAPLATAEDLGDSNVILFACSSVLCLSVAREIY